MVFQVQTPDGVIHFAQVILTVQPAPVTALTFKILDPSGNVTFQTSATPGLGDVTFPLAQKNQMEFPGDGVYKLVLEATDASGLTAMGESDVTIDNTPPTCAWIDPSSGALVQGSINGTVTAADNLSGVRAVSFVDPIDSHLSPFVLIAQTSNWLYSTYDTREKEGPTQLQAVVYDMAGNVNTCMQPVVSDNIAPTGSIAFNPAAVSYNGLMLIRSMNTVTATGTDGAVGTGVVSTVLSLDSTVLVSANSSSASSAVNTGGYPDGAHSFSSLFTDRIGHSATVTSQIVIDNSAPLVTIIAPANSAVVSASLGSVSAGIVEANGIAEKKILIDNVDTAYTELNGVFQLASPITTNGLHTVTVTAKDMVGNMGQDQHSFVIVNGTANGGPPTGGPITITPIGIGNGTVLPGNGTTTISVVVTGGSGGSPGVTVQVDGGSAVGMTPGPGGTDTFPINTTGMTDGTHTITFTTTDSQGHTTSTTLTVVVDDTRSGDHCSPLSTDGDHLVGNAVLRCRRSVTDGGPSGLLNFGVYVDGLLVANVPGAGKTASISYDLNPASLSTGDHTY